MSKKVLFISTNSRILKELYFPYMKYLHDKGYEIHIETSFIDSSKVFTEEDFRCISVGFKKDILSIKNFIAFRKTVRLLRENNYSMIQVFTPIGSIIGRTAAIFAGSRSSVIYIVHALPFYKGAPVIKNIIYKKAEKYLSKYTSAIITMNREDYNSINMFRRIEKDNIYKLNGIGVDIDKYQLDISQKEKSEIMKKLGIDNDKFNLIYIGEFTSRKNQMEFLKAIKFIGRINVLLVGDGSMADKLSGYVRENGLESKVKFIQKMKDIPKLLNVSDALILISKREGLSSTVLQAMAAGLPCVVSDIRGNADLIQEGVNGFRVPLGNNKKLIQAINKLKRNPEICAEMSRNNLEAIKKYDIKIVLGEMEKIYSKYLFEKQ